MRGLINIELFFSLSSISIAMHFIGLCPDCSAKLNFNKKGKLVLPKMEKSEAQETKQEPLEDETGGKSASESAEVWKKPAKKADIEEKTEYRFFLFFFVKILILCIFTARKKWILI